jgi:hypothetical protein
MSSKYLPYVMKKATHCAPPPSPTFLGIRVHAKAVEAD